MAVLHGGEGGYTERPVLASINIGTGGASCLGRRAVWYPTGSSSYNVVVSGVPAVGASVRQWSAGHDLSRTQQSMNGMAHEYDTHNRNHAKTVYLIYVLIAASSAASQGRI